VEGEGMNKWNKRKYRWKVKGWRNGWIKGSKGERWKVKGWMKGSKGERWNDSWIDKKGRLGEIWKDEWKAVCRWKVKGEWRDE